MYFGKSNLFKTIASPSCIQVKFTLGNWFTFTFKSRLKKKQVSLDSDCISANSFRLCVMLRPWTHAFIPILGALRSSLDFSQSPTQADFCSGMKTWATNWLSDRGTHPVDRQPLLNTDPHLLLSCKLSTFWEVCVYVWMCSSKGWFRVGFKVQFRVGFRFRPGTCDGWGMHYVDLSPYKDR